MRKGFFLFFFFTSSLFAQNKALLTSISIYKQNFTGDEPVRVNVYIANSGTREESFSLSDAAYQSISFDLRTAANEPIELRPAVDARMRTVYSNPNLYRTLTLMPGESYSASFDLRDYFNITANGAYYIRARFYPDPDNRALVFDSEYAAFTHTPPDTVRRALDVKAQQRVRALETAKAFLPNEAVQDLFEAQMAKDWERFLLHIDAERLINAFPVYADQYNASTDGAFRLDLLEQFRRFLTVHWNLSLTGYEITETRITKETAEVTADAYESVRISQRRIRYNFRLYRNGEGRWLIDNYEVLALN